MRNPDGLDQRLADAREVIALAERAGERDFALEVRYFHIADLIELGDIAGADRRNSRIPDRGSRTSGQL